MHEFGIGMKGWKPREKEALKNWIGVRKEWLIVLEMKLKTGVEARACLQEDVMMQFGG